MAPCSEQGGGSGGLSFNHSLPVMPSYIALAATALASVHERILPIPLLVLGGAVPQLLPFVQHVLLRPFTLAATVIKHLGLLVQIAFLLQGILFEALGDGLNS